jgi:predicted nucleic acid-binding protein
MNARFADTSLFVAYLNRADENHALACEYLTEWSTPFVTTTWVLTEFGNFLCETANRRLFAPFVKQLRLAPLGKITPESDELFDRGLDLYSRRRDKEWSMTDCISFVVMKEEGITQALSADHHFRQAGFTILLK